MTKEIHEIWVNEDGSFECESHSIKGEKCIDELRKLLEGLAEIDEFEKKKEFYDRRNKGLKSKSENQQKRGGKL
tara:strand:+ start:282 stop:503 length:222 start_codon:yes stop_codon:yes gene_type:complete